MNLSETIIKEEYPLKYYYCCLDNKDFILLGDEQGIIYSAEKIMPIGTILIELINNADTYIEFLENCKNEISNQKQFKDDEELNQDIINTKILYHLDENLKKINYIFKFEDISTFMSQEYRKLFNEYNLIQLKYNKTERNIQELENMELKRFNYRC